MFSVKHNECVGFESPWKVKKVSLVGSTQTSDSSKVDMEVNTTEKKDIEVQTENEPLPSTCEVDEEKLAEWLKKIYPRVKKELDDNANSRAFRGYRLSSDNSDANCRLVQTVDVSSQVKDSEIGAHVSSLSWNSTNKTLAIACVYKHKSWCYHEGFVAIYTLNRDDNLPEVPRTKLKTTSCVNVIAFHSVLPAVIAAGLFSGSIIIWNIQNEEEKIIAQVDGHGDGITQLSWIADINSTKNIILASSSLDGFLTLWNFNYSESLLIIKEKHQMKSPLLPKNSDSESQGTIKNVIRGVICFDFSKHTPDMFIVGAEGGLVIQCSLLGTKKLKGSTAEAPLLDSTFKYYEPHKGEINFVSFSPNRKDMFMTSGSDCEIRIYMLGQEEPAQIIFLKNALNCITWIPYEEKIIAGCGKNGIIEIFQLVKGGEPLKNTSKEKVASNVLTQMAINKAKNCIVAVGTESGRLQMWRVPWGLFGNL